jgi:hypothetical protein
MLRRSFCRSFCRSSFAVALVGLLFVAAQPAPAQTVTVDSVRIDNALFPQMRAIAVFSNGTSQDVTSSADWSSRDGVRAIAGQTRHRSLASLGPYVRIQDAWTNNAAVELWT